MVIISAASHSAGGNLSLTNNVDHSTKYGWRLDGLDTAIWHRLRQRNIDRRGIMKSILTYFGDDAGLETRLQAALDLARTNGGHLTGILVRPTMPFLGIDPFGGTAIPQSVFDALFQMEAQARSKVESKLAHEDVSWTDLSANDPVSASLIVMAL
jgi:hypothetical protein